MKHLKGLDGIRALAVLLVIFAHAGIANVPGGFGVTVFFFLSGFLITTLMQREFIRTGEVNYKNFMIRRGLRIFIPLYLVYFCLLILAMIGFYPASFTFEGVLSQVFFLTNYYKVFFDDTNLLNGTGILWSLAVEEHFYILFPLVFIFFAKKSLKSLFVFLVILLFLVLTWRIFLFLEGYPSERFYLSTDTRFDSILYGVILSLWMFKRNLFRHVDEILNIKDYYVLFISLILLLFTFVMREDFFRDTIRYSIQGLALMPLFYYAVTRSSNVLFSWLNHQFLRRIGVYSYMMYLVHFPVKLLLEFYTPVREGWVELFLLIIISFGVAALSYRYIEAPVLHFKNRFK